MDIYNYFNLLRQDLIKGSIGDINNDGEINASDALLALQSLVELIDLNETQTAIADVDDDGDVDAADALMILQCSVDLIQKEDFPAAW